MDIKIAINQYLSDKQHLIDIENDSINIVDNQIHTFNYRSIVQPTKEELEACYELAIKEQEQKKNKEIAISYLKEADWKRNRHLSQKALGITTSLSDKEYLAMESECQACREIL